MEDTRAPAIVARLPIKFYSNDIDVKFLICAIEEGNLHGSFRVAPSNKMDACELRTEIQLDREKVERYLLNVSLTIGTVTDFTIVAIQVIDANDNAPRFIFSKNRNENKKDNELFDGYFAVVPSLAPLETHVITVKVRY